MSHTNHDIFYAVLAPSSTISSRTGTSISTPSIEKRFCPTNVLCKNCSKPSTAVKRFKRAVRFDLIVVDAMNLIPPFDATTRVLHYLVYEKIHKLKFVYTLLLIYELHQVQCEYLLVHLAILFCWNRFQISVAQFVHCFLKKRLSICSIFHRIDVSQRMPERTNLFNKLNDFKNFFNVPCVLRRKMCCCVVPCYDIILKRRSSKNFKSSCNSGSTEPAPVT